MARRKRLVLIDDSETEMEFVRRALEAIYPGAEFHAFRNGADALAHLCDAPEVLRADVILLDLKLPGLDGHAILKALRERFAPGDLPVVVFTSSREASDLARAYAAGANSYVVKPLVYEHYGEVVGLVARYWLDANAAIEREGDEHD
ncbi:MAG TPA: response regulator [Longimicrobiales bacterium]|nr:response regulator [Longimicrobiales bacterium]